MEGWMEGGREGGREGWRDGWMEGGREGGRDRGREKGGWIRRGVNERGGMCVCACVWGGGIQNKRMGGGITPFPHFHTVHPCITWSRRSARRIGHTARTPPTKHAFGGFPNAITPFLRTGIIEVMSPTTASRVNTRKPARPPRTSRHSSTGSSTSVFACKEKTTASSGNNGTEALCRSMHPGAAVSAEARVRESRLPRGDHGCKGW